MRILQDFKRRQNNSNATRFLLIGINTEELLEPICWSHNKEKVSNRMALTHNNINRYEIIAINDYNKLNKRYIMAKIRIELEIDNEIIYDNLTRYCNETYLRANEFNYDGYYILNNYNEDDICEMLLNNYIDNYIFNRELYIIGE